EEVPRPIQEINPQIPEWLVHIIDKLHAKNPADRFQSAAEVADLLGRHLAQLQPPSPVEARTATRAATSRLVPAPLRLGWGRFWGLSGVAFWLMSGALLVSEVSGWTRFHGTAYRAEKAGSEEAVSVAQATL